MYKHIVHALVFGVGTLLASPAGRAQDWAWSEPQVIATGDDILDVGIAADSSGNWNVVYGIGGGLNPYNPPGEYTGEYTSINYLSSTGGAGVMAEGVYEWLPEFPYSVGTWLASPAVDIDPTGALHVAYVDGRPGDYTTSLMYTNNRAGPWSEPQVIATGDDILDVGIAADSSGNWNAVYSTGLGDYTSINYLSSAGSAAVMAEGWLANPAIDIDPTGALHVAYVDGRPGDYTTSLVYTNNRTGSWSEPQVIATGDDILDVGIAADSSGNWNVVYSTSGLDPHDLLGDYTSINYLSSTGGAAVMAEGVYDVYEPGGTWLANPAIDIDPTGALHVAYIDGRVGDATNSLMYTVHQPSIYGLFLGVHDVGKLSPRQLKVGKKAMATPA